MKLPRLLRFIYLTDLSSHNNDLPKSPLNEEEEDFRNFLPLYKEGAKLTDHPIKCRKFVNKPTNFQGKCWKDRYECVCSSLSYFMTLYNAFTFSIFYVHSQTLHIIFLIKLLNIILNLFHLIGDLIYHISCICCLSISCQILKL